MAVQHRVLGNPNSSEGLSRCYTEPLPPLPPQAPAELRLSLGHDGSIQGDPEELSSESSGHLHGAVVQVSNETLPHGDSSGFVVRTASEELVVVTTAHGVRHAQPGQLFVTDNQGNRSRVEGGSVLWQRGGRVYNHKPAPGEDLSRADRDVAILRLAQPVGSTTLTLASAQPEPGDGGHFAGFPVGYEPGDVATGHGVISGRGGRFSSNPGEHTLLVRDMPTGDQARMRGYDGSPVVNQHGQVIGMITGGYAPAPIEKAQPAIDMLFNLGSLLAGGLAGQRIDIPSPQLDTKGGFPSSILGVDGWGLAFNTALVDSRGRVVHVGALSVQHVSVIQEALRTVR